MQAQQLSSTASPTSFPILPEPLALAHDAGNLLNALGLYCDLLERPDVLKPEHRHYAAELRVIADRSWRLLSQMSEPKSVPFLKPGSVLDMDFVQFLRHSSAPHLVFFTAPEGLPTLPVSAEVLERILLNLVKNAFEALQRQGNPCGIVHVTLAVEDNHFVLTVNDNGPGMELPVAGRFVRPRGAPMPGSRGLGHRILHEMVQATGASFEIRVRPGRGSSFCFRWPLVEACGGWQRTC